MQSPFKFLDTYQREDKERYFGRDKETAQLYNAVFASNLTLLYGGSGVGKSSLINCGLANKFYDTDWLPLYIRRTENINAALERGIATALDALATEPIYWQKMPIDARLSALFKLAYKPIYLIFDQFEEIYVLGDAEEQNAFYACVQEILRSGLQIKIIISIREEWIAALNKFERMVPTLFDNRLRVEKMNDYNLMRVIVGSVKTAKGVNIDLREPRSTVPLILEHLRDPRDGIDLTNLQVYLDRLYRADLKRQMVEYADAVVFDTPLVEKLGDMKNVLSDFIEEQIEEIEFKLKLQGARNPRGIPLEVLITLVSSNGTKQPRDAATILENLPPNRQITAEQVTLCLEEFVNIKLLRQVE